MFDLSIHTARQTGARAVFSPRSTKSSVGSTALALVLYFTLGIRPFFAAEPLKLHPENPHYFLFRGKPTVLVTSAEHYGAVLNLDFDYIRYLDELQAKGLNLTRIWPGGPYLEIPGTFDISKNTLAPLANRFSCIWQRSSTPGYRGGGNKYDLTSWNEAHIARLKDFVAQASKRGVVVELSLFCPFYKEELWNVSPWKAENNINGVGNLARTETLTLKNGALLAIQEAMVRKIVSELKDFDNLYYEICNEPYFGGVALDWQNHIAETIVKAGSAFPQKHLIAQNIANGSTRIENPHSAVSIFNFHYSRPPNSVSLNYGLKKVIGLNETGFDGPADATYRIQGWDFILAGGALYNNLDYSFTSDHPDGTFVPDPKTPGGGSPVLRSQLKVLKDFIHSFDFVKMVPHDSLVRGGLPVGATARTLADSGKAYAIYVHHGQPGYDHTNTGTRSRPPYRVAPGPQQLELLLDVPSGSYQAEWISTKSGHIEKTEKFKGTSKLHTVRSPSYSEDIALRIKRLRSDE
jgi:Cellulase (glycosyl hydrolase family 5)